jgi:hypothetical protein
VNEDTPPPSKSPKLRPRLKLKLPTPACKFVLPPEDSQLVHDEDDAVKNAATTQAYWNAVDLAWAAIHEEQSTPTKMLSSEEQVTREELCQLFSRGQDETHAGLTCGFFEGTQHQMVVRGRSPRHRGVHVGRVLEGSSRKQGLLIASTTKLKLGDGLVVDRGLAEEEELGGPIFDIEEMGVDIVRIRFGREVERKWKHGDDNARKGMAGGLPLAPAGAHVWRTGDATVDKKMRRLSEAAPPRVLAQVKVEGNVGEPLRVTISSGDKFCVGVTDGFLEQAQTSRWDPSNIRKAIGKFGNTCWAINGEVDVDGVADDAWCPVSWIKEARRRAVEEPNCLPYATRRHEAGFFLQRHSISNATRGYFRPRSSQGCGKDLSFSSCTEL